MTLSQDSIRPFLRRAAAVPLVALMSTLLLAAPPAYGQAPQSRAAVAQSDVWPREYASPEGRVLFYQPQLDSFDGARFDAHAAVAIDRKAASQTSVFGVIWFTSDVEVDKETRRVTFLNFRITKASFPSEPANVGRYMAAMQQVVPNRTRTISLDRIESALAEKGVRNAVSGRALQNTPPTIVFAAVPTLHIPVDGKPVLKPTSDTNFDRIINTRQLILFDKAQNQYFLRLYDGWMIASALAGPWQVAASASKALDKVAQSVAALTEVDLMTGILPEEAGDAASTAPPSLKSGPVPAIHVSVTPTEVIVTEGAANFAPISGTQLHFVPNTTSNVFRHDSDKSIYVLLSGRWYRAGSMSGPWTHVPGKQLPSDFAAIPDDSAKENVKASVPGTAQAQEALIANEIPQTATVRRGTAPRAAIVYDGAPQFRPIESTSLSYAVNTGTPVIQLDDVTYYSVQDGVWFVSASPQGPWEVTDQIPAEIYSIPPSSPLYYVTFVRVYNADGQEVQVGYTPGYYGAVSEDEDDDGEADSVVYGTGYYYDPWVDDYWWGYPYTWGWGYGMAWTPWCGWCWGWGGHWGWNSIGGIGWGWGPGPWGGAIAWGPGGWIGSTGNVYNRWGNTSVISRHGAAFNRSTGNYWTRDLGAAYNSRTGTIAAGHKASVTNVFNGNTVSAGKGIVYNPNTGNATRVSGIKGESGGAARLGDNVYAGKDGQLYRKGDNGWQEFKPGSGWSDMRDQAQPKVREDRPTVETRDKKADRKARESSESLDRERKARESGEKRSKDYKSFDRGKTVDRGRVNNFPSNRGSFGGRGGGGMRGGGMRGGGGRRR